MALEKDDPYDPNLNGRVYTWGNNGQGWGDGREKAGFEGIFVEFLEAHLV